MRIHVWPLTCDVCGGDGMGTSSANAAAWDAHSTVVHNNPEVCRMNLEQRKRELDKLADELKEKVNQ